MEPNLRTTPKGSDCTIYINPGAESKEAVAKRRNPDDIRTREDEKGPEPPTIIQAFESFRRVKVLLCSCELRRVLVIIPPNVTELVVAVGG